MTIVYRKTLYRSRCQFSKQIIQTNTNIIQFTQEQYNYFIENIKRIFSRLPDDIIDLIIKKTNYEKYINHWGLIEYVNWLPKSIKLINREILYDYDSDSDC